MELTTRRGFEATRAFWVSFWTGTNRRPAVRMLLPRPGRTVDAPAYLACFDGDMRRVADQAVAWAESVEFLGDSLPFYYLEYGPDTFAAYLGADLRLAADRSTTWSVPFVEDWDQAEIRFHRDGTWWQKTVEAAGILRERCGGRLLVCPPTLCANIDALAALRGAERLLVDLLESPQAVARALGAVNRAHAEVMEEIHREFEFDRWGAVNIEGAYIQGRLSRPQSDASCMIGPDLFEQFVVPGLRHEALDNDAFVYHLDGPQAIHHLEALCAMEELDAIAWIPGAASENQDWGWLYDRIDALGKGQWRYRTPKDVVARAWERSTSTLLSFAVDVRSRAEAEDLLGTLERIERRSPPRPPRARPSRPARSNGDRP
jgi:hypothetical protein